MDISKILNPLDDGQNSVHIYFQYDNPQSIVDTELSYRLIQRENAEVEGSESWKRDTMPGYTFDHNPLPIIFHSEASLSREHVQQIDPTITCDPPFRTNRHRPYPQNRRKPTHRFTQHRFNIDHPVIRTLIQKQTQQIESLQTRVQSQIQAQSPYLLSERQHVGYVEKIWMNYIKPTNNSHRK